MSVASPAIGGLHLEEHGLRWSHAAAVVGDPRHASDDDAPVIYRDPRRAPQPNWNATTAEMAPTGGGWFQLWDSIKRPFF